MHTNKTISAEQVTSKCIMSSNLKFYDGMLIPRTLNINCLCPNALFHTGAHGLERRKFIFGSFLLNYSSNPGVVYHASGEFVGGFYSSSRRICVCMMNFRIFL